MSHGGYGFGFHYDYQGNIHDPRWFLKCYFIWFYFKHQNASVLTNSKGIGKITYGKNDVVCGDQFSATFAATLVLVVNPNSYLDSEATNHIVFNGNNLSQQTYYTLNYLLGIDKVLTMPA